MSYAGPAGFADELRVVFCDATGTRGRSPCKACADAGIPGVHFYDLRHTGGTAAAITGATIKELMARLGHSSPRAAMIYQHATRDRDKAIADALGQLADKAHTKPSGPELAQPSTHTTRNRSKSAGLPAERATGIEPA